MTTYSVDLVIPGDCDLERAGETVRIEVEESEYVLAAARDQGVWLPAFCQQGWCTTCAATLLDGEVDHSDAKRYYPVDEAADFVLTCVAKPRSDLELRVCQEAAILEHREKHDLPP